MDSLMERAKPYEELDARLSDDPGILFDVQDAIRLLTGFPIVRSQIRLILESCPSIFPEDWQSPDGYDDLSLPQKECYARIAQAGLFQCPGPIIEETIRQGKSYLKRWSDKTNQ